MAGRRSVMGQERRIADEHIRSSPGALCRLKQQRIDLTGRVVMHWISDTISLVECVRIRCG